MSPHILNFSKFFFHFQFCPFSSKKNSQTLELKLTDIGSSSEIHLKTFNNKNSTIFFAQSVEKRGYYTISNAEVFSDTKNVSGSRKRNKQNMFLQFYKLMNTHKCRVEFLNQSKFRKMFYIILLSCTLEV